MNIGELIRRHARWTPDKIVTPKSVENAIRVLMAIGGSTNAVLHLTAIASEAQIPLTLEEFDTIASTSTGVT